MTHHSMTAPLHARCTHAPIKHAPSIQLKFHDIIDDSNKNRYERVAALRLIIKKQNTAHPPPPSPSPLPPHPPPPPPPPHMDSKYSKGTTTCQTSLFHHASHTSSASSSPPPLPAKPYTPEDWCLSLRPFPPPPLEHGGDACFCSALWL